MAHPRGKKSRRQWFGLHSWVGLKLSLLFFFVSLTGTVAVYAYEVDWLLSPAMRVQAPAGVERQAPGTLLAAALQAYPGWTPGFMHLNLPSYMAVELIAEDELGELRRIYINPYTAEIQGVAGWFNAHRFLREAHRHLMLPLKWGLTVVSLLSIPLLLSMISAFPIFKRWWRGFFKLPKRDDPPRRWWGNLHRWLGLWSLPFILVIALTGFWYLIEFWGASAPQASHRWQPLPEAGALSPRAEDLNRTIDSVLVQWPGFELNSIWFPGGGKPLVLQGQASALLVRPRANAILLDPSNGQVMGRVRGEELSAHQRIAEAADPLHFGTFGGQATRLLWFVWGAALCLLSGSGVWIYALRLAGRRQPPRWRSIWRGLKWRWAQLALIITCLWISGLAAWG
jgi:uncharacterized iron-regulated membrane protein